MKKIIIISALILLILGYFTVRRIMTREAGKNKAVVETIMTVSSSPAETGNITGKLSYTGTVHGVIEASILSQTAGVVEQLNAQLGKRCSAGQVLAIVQNAAQKSAVDQAKAQLLTAEAAFEKSKSDLKRTERLFNEKVVTKDNLELAQLGVKSAEAQVKAAQAGLKAAEKMLADTYIKATISGYIAAKDLDRGATVAPGVKILSIADISKLKINIMVSETDIVRLKVGDNVAVRVDALPDKDFTGKISNIGLMTQEGMRSYPVEVIIPNTKNLDIKSGMFARCELSAESKKSAVLVPEAAVIMNNDGTSQVFISSGGRVSARKLQLGVKSDGKYEVRSGLSAGEKVVTMGKERLTDGMKIREN